MQCSAERRLEKAYRRGLQKAWRLQAQVNVFEAGMMIHSGFFFGGTAVKASGTAQDVRWTSALRGPEWNGDAAARCRRQRSKAVPLCKKAECTFLMINQLRENIGNMYKPYKIPCGTAIAHACSQILWFTKGSLLDEKGEEKSSTYSDPVGNVVNVRVEKNKVTKNDRRLDSYTLNYFRGVDDGTDTIDLGIKLNVIEQTGAWFKVPVSDGSEKKLQGRAVADARRYCKYN